MSNRIFDNMRDWLAHLAATDRVAVIRDNVSLEFELAAIAKRLDGVKAAFFPHPGGHAIPVVSGFMSKRAWIAEALGVREGDLLQHVRRAVESPLPWREVQADAAPAQQVVHDHVDIRTLLPIPRHNEHDSAPYISAGLVIARNPKTGVQNVSINRIQINAPDRMAMLILPRHLHAFHGAAEEAGESLPVAVVIGASPAALLASQAVLPIDHDELTVAGALEREPLQVVKCQTSEVRVPALSEIVIEGHLLPGARELEGPFGEFPKYYSPQEKREVIAIDRVTHRRNPIYHTIVPAAMEHLLLGGIPREATLLSHLKRSFPNVTDVHLAVGGVCRYHLYVQMKKAREGEPKNVIMGAFGGHYDIKQVIVVDEDVDVHDSEQVEWAVATRFQPDRDLVVVNGAQGSILDPSTDRGIGAKWGLDATRPLQYEGLSFTKVHIPGEESVDLEQAVVGGTSALRDYLG
ncbi:MAG: UbiD family decarboxylase [Pseudomonadota bacterium]|nr:UbiD family decarboxylase [Pseudomonadota bacterium]